MKSGRKIHAALTGPADVRLLKNGELRSLIRFLERRAKISLSHDNLLCEALCQAAIRFMKDKSTKKVRKILG